MKKEQAEDKIRKLVIDFKNLNSAQLKEYNEFDVRKNFILPLFSALGWGTETYEVREEFDTSKGTVDFSFMLGHLHKFFLEAKRFSVNLDEWTEKVVNYGWNKGVSWVVLTNFKELKIFNTETKERRRFLEFQYTEYLKRFDELWLLSKEAFENDLLNKEADRVGVGLKREKVTERLAKDLIYWRTELAKYFKAHNKKIPSERIDEAVQVILDRLVFIRACEDRNIEPSTLLAALRKWEIKKDYRIDFIKDLNKIFRQFDDWYDSKLFEKHFCESLETETSPFMVIINGLYKTDGARYDFSAIDADILGSIYEQYLGTLQEKSQREERKDILRKEHGIYYTPYFVVNYIVRTTLNEFFQTRTRETVKKLKILDPACGSGSFLIRAFDEMERFLVKEKTKEETPTLIKKTILNKNIYGVDFDAKATEISRLNLLLKALKTRSKLPKLSNNIKEGNSLISETEKELKEYYGKRWKEKKAFTWKKEFPEILSQGGFDIIVGNPPWGATIDEDIKYFEDNYPDSTKGHKDIYKIFIDKALQLLKKGGVLGFIIPSTCLFQVKFQDIRTLLNKYKLLYIINLGERVFSGAEAPCCIIICEKSNRDSNKVKVLDLSHSKSNEYKAKCLISPRYTEIDQAVYDKTGGNAFIAYYQELQKEEVYLDEILDCRDAGVQYAAPGAGKVGKGDAKLGTRLFYQGLKKEDEKDVELIIGSDVNRWWMVSKSTNYLKKDYKSIIHKDAGEWIHFTEHIFNASPRIIWRQTADHIIATIDNSKKWFKKSVHAGVLRNEYKDKIDLRYILAFLNSKYLNHIYIETVKESGRVFPQVKLNKIKKLPIKIIPKKEQKPFIELVDKLLSLGRELYKIKTSPLEDQDPEYIKTKKKMEEIEKMLDQRIYKLYGLKKVKSEQ